MDDFVASAAFVTTLILDAFSDYTVPDDVQEQMQKYIESGTYHETREVYKSLIGRNWKNIDLAVFRRGEPAMLTACSHVIQWFLPGYMSAALSEFSDYEYIYGLICHIVITSSKDGPQKLGISPGLLNEKQRESVVAFLGHTRDFTFWNAANIQDRIDRGIAQIRSNRS